MTQLPPLPITDGEFRALRQDGLLYVDKTRQIVSLLAPQNRYVFLARPRRFGKTLLVSTLEALFEGAQELFVGTWLESQEWDWTPHPVVRLDMAAWHTGSLAELQQRLSNRLWELCAEKGVVVPDRPYGADELFRYLLTHLSGTRRVVVLIDEYDAPLVQNLDHAQLLAIRDFLRDFYGILKVVNVHLRFVLVTGVTRFARTSIFSGLNNLHDVSALDGHSDLVGFTESELQTVLHPYCQKLAFTWGCSTAEVGRRMAAWYNGYLFSSGGQRLYNPYSTLKCLQEGVVENYWAHSGTPTFLTRLLARRQVDPREFLGRSADQVATAVYDLEQSDLTAVMYQTGYLSLRRDPTSGNLITDFPNREVEQSFNESLLGVYAGSPTEAQSVIKELAAALGAADLETFWPRFNVLLRQIPYQIQGERHQYFQLVLHLVCLLLGYEFRTNSERSTQRGRMDTVVEMPDQVFIFECKVDESASAALAQIEDRGYAQSFLDQGLTVTGVGVNFDSRARQAESWEVRRWRRPLP